MSSRLVTLLGKVDSKYGSLDIKRSAIEAGFISPTHRNFLIFVDDPSHSYLPSPGLADGETKHDVPSSFDWGRAALLAIKRWREEGMGGAVPFDFPWHEDKDHRKLEVA